MYIFTPAPPSQEEIVTSASSKEKDSKNEAKSAKTVAVQTQQRYRFTSTFRLVSIFVHAV